MPGDEARRYAAPNAVSNAVAFAKFYSCSHDAVIRVYDEAGNVIEKHEQAGDLKEPQINSGVFRIALESFLIAGRQNEN